MKRLLSLTVVFLTWTMIMCQGNEKLKNLQTTSAYECGYRNRKGLRSHFCDYENKASYGEFPWIVNILNEREDGDSDACIGSIISPNVILSVAHCLHNKAANTLKVRAGEWDKKTDSEIFPVQDRYVAEVIVHKNFDKRTLYNNIALLILTKPFKLNESVKSICLPPPDTQLDYQSCVVMGWGKTSPDSLDQSTLTKMDFSVISNDQCQSAFRKTRLGRNFTLHQSFICTAGIVGKDTCEGFRGSPLVCPIVGTNDRYFQVGMVAWNIECANGNPGLYVNIAELRPWINEQLVFQYKEKASFLVLESTKPKAKNCGYQKINGLGCQLTENHNESKYEKFPWMVSLFREISDSNNSYLCGGSVIYPNVILTVAHYVYNMPINQLKVRAGVWDAQNGLKIFPIQHRNVAKVIIHKNFDKRRQYNNIALLILSTPLEFTENVNSICLPPANTQFDETKCIVTGRGKTSPNDLDESTLTKMGFSVISNDQCQSAFRKTPELGANYKLHSSFICTAGIVGKDTCDRFGGSPLVCPIVGTSDRYFQVGMVAWGIGCANGNPGAYVNVAYLKSWIDDQLKFERIDGASATSELTNNEVVFPKPITNICGHRNIHGLSSKLSGDSGIQTKYGEFTWMAIVFIHQKDNDFNQDIYQCGGSIIHKMVVLVTAKCVDNKPLETLKIKAGEWDTQTNRENFPIQYRYVAKVIVHENYIRDRIINNIALLVLTEPFEFNESVNRICLPPPNAQFDNQKCLVTGWGKNKPTGKYQVILTKIDLTVIPRDHCQSTLRDIFENSKLKLDPSLICTEGTSGNDTCMGYEGSPLACPIVGEKNRYYQAGLFAWTLGCSLGNPGVYVNVAKLSPWIRKKLVDIKL